MLSSSKDGVEINFRYHVDLLVAKPLKIRKNDIITQ